MLVRLLSAIFFSDSIPIASKHSMCCSLASCSVVLLTYTRHEKKWNFQPRHHKLKLKLSAENWHSESSLTHVMLGPGTNHQRFRGQQEVRGQASDPTNSCF